MFFSAKRDVFFSNDVCFSLAKPLGARSLCESLLSSTDERDANEGQDLRHQKSFLGFCSTTETWILICSISSTVKRPSAERSPMATHWAQTIFNIWRLTLLPLISQKRHLTHWFPVKYTSGGCSRSLHFASTIIYHLRTVEFHYHLSPQYNGVPLSSITWEQWR